jgi:uncharacterized membrane protein
MVPTPARISRVGRVAYGIAIVALGADGLACGDFLPGLQPAPAGLPARAALAYLTGAILVAAGAGIAADRRTLTAARVTLGLACLWLLAFHAPVLLAHPGNGGAWTSAFEIFAIAGAAAVIAVPSRPALGRLCFGLSLPAFGVLHFVYRDYVASVIPAVIPGHLFWAYATGVAHIAAGAGIAFAIKPRLAATLAGAMFGSWVVILHLPRALAALDHPAEWTSLFVALAMCGGAWLVAGTMPAVARRP